MARDRSPVGKLSRREGIVIGNSEKVFARRPYAPGEHGQNTRGKVSEYGVQLREKQKVKRIYGILEKQFRIYFARADRGQGVTGERLLQLLETRLDNVVYQMGFARTRRLARQLVTHGHFEVNGRKVNIPSFAVKVGDEIVVRASSKKNQYFSNLSENPPSHIKPDWVSFDPKSQSGKLEAVPQRTDLPSEIDEQLIVEYYSR
jgi:small subunit ribosomal protein S4